MKDSNSKADVETHEIAGHTVEIRRLEGREELRIDGVRKKFFVSQDGYNLDDAAFAPPQKSLLDAVKLFLEGRKREPKGN
jgi:hypothetical protein